MTRPNVVVLGGANGSGKTTAAPALLKGTLRVSEFVNADTIAQGLSGFNPEGSAIEAGRIMLRRMKQLAEQRADFAFESTLRARPPNVLLRAGDALATSGMLAKPLVRRSSATPPRGLSALPLSLRPRRARDGHYSDGPLASRTLASWIRGLMAFGYESHFVFLWLPNTDFAVARVAERVRLGGHHVPEEVVRRRYRKGLQNFLSLYRPLATTWRLYDNSGRSGPRLIATGGTVKRVRIFDQKLWDRISGGSAE